MLRNSVFGVRIVEVCAFLSSNNVDLLMLSDGVFRLRNVKKYAVQSRKGVNLLMLRNRVSGCETFRNVQCHHARGLIC